MEKIDDLNKVILERPSKNGASFNKEAGRMDIVAQLKQLCREEIESFGGVWDEAKLE